MRLRWRTPNLAGSGTPSARVRVAHGSWFAALPAEMRGHLLLVVANPPYLADGELPGLAPEVAKWEPVGALVAGPTGLEAFEALLAEAPDWLEPSGSIVFELAPHQAEAVAGLTRSAGFGSVEVHRDLAGRDRVLVARRAESLG